MTSKNKCSKINSDAIKKAVGRQGDENLSKIKAVTKDKRLIITSRPVITSGSKNVDELSVVFDKTWDFDSAEYFVNFFIDDDKNGVIRHLSVSGNVGRCEIPIYITRNEGFFHFGVFARADGDIIKTSDIVGYEVKRGICVEPNGDEHDTLAELKKRFIDMINREIPLSTLYYEMRFEDIELNFSEYMQQLFLALQNYGVSSDSLYNIIKNNIDPDIEKLNDPTDAFIAYSMIIEEYFRESVPMIEFDSVNDERLELDDFRHDIYNLLRTYVDSDFNEESDLLTYVIETEDYLRETTGQLNSVVSSLYSLYTGGNE